MDAHKEYGIKPVIHYRVQHSPDRGESLARLLIGLPAQTEVVTDDGPPPGNPWRCFQLCLQEPSPETTHIAIFQDDAVTCRNLPQAIELIIQHQPDAVICLFFPGSAKNTYPHYIRAMSEHKHYVSLSIRDFLPVVATLWPVEMAQELLVWAETAQLPGMPKHEVRSDDAVCGLWQRTTRAKVLVTCPSLVQHPDDVESTIGRPALHGKDRGRVAVNWIGNDDPLGIDWSS